ncbi:MAG: hypothetical protein JO159_10390 [Acidobacteria bacterium]|nr:hypothetical protein [Acidobacteriota bacterium]MBV9626087.1 hypothetical protein [Acidobacteriota bacterium]
MKTEAPIIERRQHSREGVLGEIENLTYTVLRKYGILERADQPETKRT